MILKSGRETKCLGCESGELSIAETVCEIWPHYIPTEVCTLSDNTPRKSWQQTELGDGSKIVTGSWHAAKFLRYLFLTAKSNETRKVLACLDNADEFAQYVAPWLCSYAKLRLTHKHLSRNSF